MSQGVLIVLGVREDGHREILAVDVADTESESTYSELFISLKGRGLSGVRLVISDNHCGLKSALRKHFQGVAWQRCQVHYHRNIAKMVAYKHRPKIAAGLKEVFNSSNRSLACAAAENLVDELQKNHSKVAAHIEESIEDCLSCYSFPSTHRLKIRSTNGIERLNQEIKRRTAVVRIFPNQKAV